MEISAETTIPTVCTAVSIRGWGGDRNFWTWYREREQREDAYMADLTAARGRVAEERRNRARRTREARRCHCDDYCQTEGECRCTSPQCWHRNSQRADFDPANASDYDSDQFNPNGDHYNSD